MIKCKINFLLVIAFLLLVPCMAFAQTGHGLTSVNNCTICHLKGNTVGNLDTGVTGYDTNVCLTCHISNLNTTKQKFQRKDYSNPYNTTVLTRGTDPYQNSHKWFGPSVVAKARTLEYVDDPNSTALEKINGLNKSKFTGSLFCARCHNIHGNSGDLSNAVPYLRSPNDKDQLCLNCHRQRDSCG